MDNNVETITYPYTAGEKGIPFQELVKRVQSGEYRGSFISGSGRELRYIISPNHILIEDPLNSEYKMDVSSDYQGVAQFDLHTNLSLENSKRQHHPDMFAKEFIGFALNYFKANGKDIKVCRGIWFPPNSDNYETFQKEYERHHDRVRAARATWSGKTFAEYGYTQVEDKDITVNENPYTLGFKVVANFSRPDLKKLSLE